MWAASALPPNTLYVVWVELKSGMYPQCALIRWFNFGGAVLFGARCGEEAREHHNYHEHKRYYRVMHCLGPNFLR